MKILAQEKFLLFSGGQHTYASFAKVICIFISILSSETHILHKMEEASLLTCKFMLNFARLLFVLCLVTSREIGKSCRKIVLRPNFCQFKFSVKAA